MKSISDFIDLYSSKNTRVMYRSGLNAFMEFIYGSQRKGLKSTKEELEKFNQLSIRYMEDKRDMGDDVLKFAGHLNSRPPKSAKAIMAAVRCDKKAML